MNSEEIEFLSMNNAVLHNQVEQLTKQRDELLETLGNKVAEQAAVIESAS